MFSEVVSMCLDFFQSTGGTFQSARVPFHCAVHSGATLRGERHFHAAHSSFRAKNCSKDSKMAWFVHEKTGNMVLTLCF